MTTEHNPTSLPNGIAIGIRDGKPFVDGSYALTMEARTGYDEDANAILAAVRIESVGTDSAYAPTLEVTYRLLPPAEWVPTSETPIHTQADKASAIVNAMVRVLHKVDVGELIDDAITQHVTSSLSPEVRKACKSVAHYALAKTGGDAEAAKAKAAEQIEEVATGMPLPDGVKMDKMSLIRLMTVAVNDAIDALA